MARPGRATAGPQFAAARLHRWRSVASLVTPRCTRSNTSPRCT